MSDLFTQHPGEDRLLGLLDMELAAAEERQLGDHLEACPACRSVFLELKADSEEHEKYHVLAMGLLPPPPRPWAPLSVLDDRRDVRHFPVLGIAKRSQNALSVRWLTIAAAVVLCCLLLWRFDRIQKVSAAELLTRAEKAERTRPASERTRRRIRIKARGRTLVRPALLPPETGEGSLDRELRSQFDQAHYDWEDPLSVSSFSDWRSHLAEKQDDVALSGEGQAATYTVHTSTPRGQVTDASLLLRATDLNPLRSTLNFRESGPVTIEVMPEEPEVALPPARTERTTARPELPQKIVVPTPGQVLHALAALHGIGADLGEPIDFRHGEEGLMVTGTGLTGKRQEEVARALSSVPGIVVQFEDGQPLASRLARRSGDRTAIRNSVTPLQLQMEGQLGDPAAVQELTDQILDESDAAMARAHALRTLAQQFPAPAEFQLDATDQTLLTNLRREHAQALQTHLVQVAGLLRAALGDVSGVKEAQRASGDWQSAALPLLDATKKLDLVLNSMLAEATPGTQDQSVETLRRALADALGQSKAFPGTLR